MCIAILKFWRIIQILIEMRRWDSLSSQGDTQNCSKRLILWDCYRILEFLLCQFHGLHIDSFCFFLSRFQCVVQFGLVLQKEFSAFQLSQSFPFVEIIIYFRLVFFHQFFNIMGIFNLLPLIYLSSIGLFFSTVVWSSTMAYRQMPFSFLCEEGDLIVYTIHMEKVISLCIQLLEKPIEYLPWQTDNLKN